MPPQAHDVKDAALAQLETALRLYDEGCELFSVITLAGAADEIFGKMLVEAGGEPLVAALARGATELHRLVSGADADVKAFIERANHARNSLKHYSPKTGATISFDSREEASDMLDRAISNYWRLTRDATPAMKTFIDRQRAT